MPRYYVNTSDHVAILDDEGIELPNLDALRSLLRKTLSEILRDEGDRTGVNEFTARAYDEDMRLIMSARVSFSITDQ